MGEEQWFPEVGAIISCLLYRKGKEDTDLTQQGQALPANKPHNRGLNLGDVASSLSLVNRITLLPLIKLVISGIYIDSDNQRQVLLKEKGKSYKGEGKGNPLLYSCLENSRDRGAWRATVLGVAKKTDTT